MKLTLMVILMALMAFDMISGLKCYSCKGLCPKGGLGELEECRVGSLWVCKTSYGDGEDTWRSCAMKVSDEMQCHAVEEYPISKMCYCDTDACNGSRKSMAGGFAVSILAIIILRAAI